MKNKKTDWISASDVGLYARNPKLLEDKYNGVEVSEERKAALDKGTQMHEAFNETLVNGQDKRCFIASHLYGIDDPRTNQLRAFRDRVLMPNRFGKWMVSAYYATSPFLVSLCRKNKLLDGLARSIVDRVVSLTKC
ncbi:MAG: hypothetical protein JXR47_06005 [Thiotrichales bacterium]|nr:hypothetical protein [Thiotrichales bacterium]